MKTESESGGARSDVPGHTLGGTDAPEGDTGRRSHFEEDGQVRTEIEGCSEQKRNSEFY